MLDKLPWLLFAPALCLKPEACRVRVAHCIVGHVRTFWQETVYQSIADVLVAQASPWHCADFFYVLALSSSMDTHKGGIYRYNESLLWNTAWRILPPTKYLLDPPVPPGPWHLSYHQPDCLFQCVQMFDKARLCLDLVQQHEAETGQRYDWILRSRPDLRWDTDTELPQLNELSDESIYMPVLDRTPAIDLVSHDGVQIVPRKFADHVFRRIMDKCLLRRHLGGEVWNCDAWIFRFCESEGIPISALKLAATIQRLPSIKDEFFDYHDQWYQHVEFARQVLPSSIYILGNEGELRERGRAWSDRSRAIPAELEPKEGCTTVADSQFCMPVNAQLMHLRFTVNKSVLENTKELDFSVWRTYPRNIRDLGGRNSTFLRNASRFWFRIWFPKVNREFAEASEVPGSARETEALCYINFLTPLLLRRGDCIFWTSCSRKSVNGVRFSEPRRPLSRESRVLAFPFGNLDFAAPRMKHNVGPFHAVQPRLHSAAFTFIKQEPAI